MSIKDSRSAKAFNVFNIFFMSFLMVLMLYPLLYVIFASFSDSNILMRHTGLLLAPKGFNLSSYKAVFKNPNILQGYKNTLIILVTGVSINIAMTSLGAYVLSRKNLMFRNVIMLFILFTMFFSGGLIPTYLTVSNLGLTNTYWALILPGAISTYNLIIMRTGFEAIPSSMEESAKIDGASHFIILFRIYFPLAKAVIAVMVLYYAVSSWNSWFNAMIYLQQRRDLQPLQLILRGILIENDVNSMLGGASGADQESIAETIKYAVIVVATVPILSIYPFLQKYFVKGVMIGAVKG